jgi:hypothetical protein
VPLPVKPNTSPTPDFFFWRFRTALDQIALNHLPGAITWAETALPNHYDQLIRELPSQVEAAWNRDIETFDALCLQLVRTHLYVVHLYLFRVVGHPEADPR